MVMGDSSVGGSEDRPSSSVQEQSTTTIATPKRSLSLSSKPALPPPPMDSATIQRIMNRKAALHAKYYRSITIINKVSAKAPMQHQFLEKIHNILYENEMPANAEYLLNKFELVIRDFEASPKFNFTQSKFPHTPLEESCFKLLDAVKSSITSKSAEMHHHRMARSFAPALAVISNNTWDISPPSPPPPLPSRIDTSELEFQRELVHIPARFRFSTADSQFKPPCNAYVYLDDCAVTFPPAKLHIPLNYPRLPAQLTLDPITWNGTEMFRRVFTLFTVNYNRVTNGTIRVLLDIWFYCINQAINEAEIAKA